MHVSHWIFKCQQTEVGHRCSKVYRRRKWLNTADTPVTPSGSTRILPPKFDRTVFSEAFRVSHLKEKFIPLLEVSTATELTK